MPITPASAGPTARLVMDKVKVLFPAPNPAGTPPLSLAEESRQIQAKVRAFEHRASLELASRWAVRPDALLQALLEGSPTSSTSAATDAPPRDPAPGAPGTIPVATWVPS